MGVIDSICYTYSSLAARTPLFFDALTITKNGKKTNKMFAPVEKARSQQENTLIFVIKKF